MFAGLTQLHLIRLQREKLFILFSIVAIFSLVSLWSTFSSASICRFVLINADTQYRQDNFTRQRIIDSMASRRRSVFTEQYYDQLTAYRDGGVHKFVNSPGEGQAQVTGNFMAGFIPATGELFDNHQRPVGQLFGDVTLHTYRGPSPIESKEQNSVIAYDRSIEDTNPALRESRYFHSASTLFRSAWDSLMRLYKSFAAQGPERQALVEIVQEQDHTEVNRITHFTAANQGSPLAHIQVLTSTNPAEPLHLETQWRGQIPPIPGTRKGELGRLFIFPWRETDTQLGRRNWENLDEAGTLMRIDLFRRSFAWANHDAALDSMSFQVNTEVLEKLEERMGIPVQLGTHYTVTSTFEGREIPEHILVFQRNQMLQVENVLMRKSLIIQLQQFLSHQSGAEKVILRFNRNEIRSLLASGLFGTQARRLHQRFRNQATNTNRFARLLSRDLGRTETNSQGLYNSHVVGAHQFEGSPEQLANLPRITEMENPSTDLSDGIFIWNSSQAEPQNTTGLELHFTRRAAERAIEILQSRNAATVHHN